MNTRTNCKYTYILCLLIQFYGNQLIKHFSVFKNNSNKLKCFIQKYLNNGCIIKNIIGSRVF